MKQIFIIAFLLLICTYSFAQSRIIKAKVVSPDGRTLSGATVVLIHSGKSTITDENGNFSLPINGKDTLAVSYIGYESIDIPIRENSFPKTITLKSISKELNQLVVTGYQTQKKVDLTGSVAVVSLEDIKDIPNNNLMQSLQGRVPGLYLTSSGDPNGGVGTIAVRGFNTLGYTAPLYVIDGVPTTDPSIFQSLNPNTIKTIQVLKDASSASIYGSRASNGVIIVTTKQGSKGKIKLQFNNSITIENYATKVNVLDALGQGRAIWQAAINDGVDPNRITTLFTYTYHNGNNGYPILDKIKTIPFLGGDSTEPSANTNWQNLVFHPGIITSNSLTITTGTDHSSLLFNLNYLNNTGMLKYNSGYRRYGARINVSTNMFGGKLKIGNSLQFFHSSETPVTTDLGSVSVLHNTIFVSPLIPVYTTNGDFAGPLGSGLADRNNPLHSLYIHRWDKNNDLNIFGNLFVEIDPIKNLVFKSNLGYYYDNTYQRLIQQKYLEGFIKSALNSLTINQGHELDLTWSNTLNYHLKTGHNLVDFLLGMEATTRTLVTQRDHKLGFAIQNNNYFQLSAGTGSTNSIGATTGNRLLSFFGKINYSWANKYLASITLRRDGSSRFGVNNRYGWFPAASVGWRINNEVFLRNVSWLTNLKLRSGFGVTGNQQIGDFANFQFYKTNYGTVGQPGRSHNYPVGANNGTAYDISGAGTGILPSGYVSVQAANPNLRWESTLGFNEGIDFGFLGNRLTGSFDYFFRKTTDILVRPPYPGIEGEGQIQWVNGATMSNKGWELVLGYQSRIGQLSFSINGNLFSFHNKIIYLPKSVISAYPGNVQHTILGHSPRSMFGYVVEGIFSNQDEVKKHATQPGAGLGRLMYKDLNNNGEIDVLDQTWIGIQLPDLNYGLAVSMGYKAFSLSFFLQGIQGIEVYNANKSDMDFVGLNSGVNYGQRTLKAWTPQNTKSNIPALSLVDNNNESRFSSYFIENGSYMKLRNMEIGYTFLRKAKGLNRIKIYLIGENLLTFKHSRGIDAFTGPDPENPGNNYPIPRKLTVGLNLSF